MQPDFSGKQDFKASKAACSGDNQQKQQGTQNIAPEQPLRRIEDGESEIIDLTYNIKCIQNLAAPKSNVVT